MSPEHPEVPGMDDWVVLLIFAGLFLAAWAYAQACERL